MHPRDCPEEQHKEKPVSFIFLCTTPIEKLQIDYGHFKRIKRNDLRVRAFNLMLQYLFVSPQEDILNIPH